VPFDNNAAEDVRMIEDQAEGPGLRSKFRLKFSVPAILESSELPKKSKVRNSAVFCGYPCERLRSSRERFTVGTE
jgi:hypothetical protein